ncbi:hypothetical protein Pmani_036178 [Petrolisthes manimaculis]|uniref:Coiled-coil domain-containing protein 102A n=1 Tax=Petrolisthes manimaculis TaxID=1843537 RepID=A0AAE1TPN4_9EUCA|nr:hypothetical protein Pmani_036178 [Petrolisthes manimaculis]
MAQSGGSSARRGAQAPLPPHAPPPQPHDPASLPYHWHDKQEMMQRELEEARARATQMEKTMRWWSDCTANWREKWSKVRSERNKAREEVRILRGRLEVSQRETSALKREKNDLESQIGHLAQSNHHSRPRKDPPDKPDDVKDQGSHKGDSPERDISGPPRLPLSRPQPSQNEADKLPLSTDELHFIRDAKNTNFSLLEEMFGSRGSQGDQFIGNGDGECVAPGGVEKVSVYAHKPSEATRLSEKCRAGRGVKDLICDEYSHAHNHPHLHPHPQRENDVEEKQQNEQLFREGVAGVGGSSSNNSSSQPSPSHRMSAMSDPLPDTCHGNPRTSAMSDPLPDTCHGNPRVSTMSDPLPDTCHGNPRVSTMSDPLSESCHSDPLVSAMSDPLPDTCHPHPDPCHTNPRASVMSDPLPDTCHSLPENCHANLRGSVMSDPLPDPCHHTEEDLAGAVGRDGRRGWRGGVCVSVLAGCEDGLTPEQESLEQQITMMKLKLDQASKTIQAEREEKLALHRECCKWQGEAGELRGRLEDIRASRQEAVKELVTLRTQHQKEVQCLQLEMLDEASSRECIDRRLADLRAELERLQEENAAEWGRRERLESEKLGMERENKKMRAQVTDLEERLDKRNKMTNSTPDSDVAQLKQEIADKFKELSELKHAHTKLKKVLSDKSVELLHSTRRADQYEAEVKRLRARVDELKKELAAAEDEVDSASNNIRKLQRANDELQESVENLEVQVEHLQSRLRSSQSSSLPLRTSSLLQDSDDDHAQF